MAAGATYAKNRYKSPAEGICETTIGFNRQDCLKLHDMSVTIPGYNICSDIEQSQYFKNTKEMLYHVILKYW